MPKPRGWHLVPTFQQEEAIKTLAEELGRSVPEPATRGEAQSIIVQLRQERDRRKVG